MNAGGSTEATRTLVSVGRVAAIMTVVLRVVSCRFIIFMQMFFFVEVLVEVVAVEVVVVVLRATVVVFSFACSYVSCSRSSGSYTNGSLCSSNGGSINSCRSCFLVRVFLKEIV